VWITDDPPSYAEGLTEPFGPGGSFSFDLTIGAVDTDSEGHTIIDCLDGATRCIVTTRADHTAASNRTADVKVPVTFVGQDEVEEPAPPAAATTGTLPLTGWSPGLLLLAASLLAVGGGLLLASGQIARSLSAQYRSRSSRV
jgi:hypothetical protein